MLVKKANKPASNILNMPLDKVWIFTRGAEPQLVDKYNLIEYENFHE